MPLTWLSEVLMPVPLVKTQDRWLWLLRTRTSLTAGPRTDASFSDGSPMEAEQTSTAQVLGELPSQGMFQGNGCRYNIMYAKAAMLPNV